MSSIGANYAGVYVMKKHQKEKMKKKMEEERSRKEEGNTSIEDHSKVGGEYYTIGRNKKVHPSGNFVASDLVRNQ